MASEAKPKYCPVMNGGIYEAKSVRILTITNVYPNPYQPNLGIVNHHYLRALSASHEVSVIAPILWIDELLARIRKGKQLPESRELIHGGLPVKHPRYFYTPWICRNLYGLFFDWSIRDTVYRHAKTFRPDLIFTPWIYPDGWASVRVAKRLGVPVVVMSLGSDVLLSGAYQGRQPQTIETLQKADGIITVSQDIANKAEEFGVPKSKIRVVYGGVDRSIFKPGSRTEARSRLGLDTNQKMVVFIGNLVPVKGLDVLIEACHRLMKEGQKFDCYLIGNGPLRGNLQQELVNRGLENYVHLLGPRPHAQLPDWYRAADVFVLPSRSEGVPNVLLESLSCHTPFVASRVGGIPEIATFGPSKLVSPENSQELADGIKNFLSEFHPQDGSFGYDRSYEDVAQELSDFFIQVMTEYRALTRPNRLHDYKDHNQTTLTSTRL